MAILTEVVEASSSSPSTTYDHKYDVFLSFRGVDTRLSFTNHLHTALVNANLTTFLDDEEIQTGDFLKPELESAIKASRASIIVLSKNYAYSTWCLDELALILEQKRNSDQIVIPVFYHVEPTDVRKQQSSFGEAMEKHTLKMEAETNVEERNRLADKIEIWRKALMDVSGLKGKNAKGRLETELIEELLNDIYDRLGGPYLRTTTLPLLIGMKHHIEHISSWLKDGSSNTDILTIWGMGGIGKTSLAKYVYELHRHEYKSSFIGNISTHARNNHGLLDFQKQLYGDISKRNLAQDADVCIYTSAIENALARKKVFLVLDDVDNLGQLDALLGNKGLHPGSKIMITTRDASLVKKCALFKRKIKPTHSKCTLKPLSDDASLQLLCHHAFTCNYPNEGYEEVSKELARYCDGLPLALEVLGKSLYNQDVCQWNYYIDMLKKELDPHIRNVLQTSYDFLPFENDKVLFKDIACFFVGIDRDLTETILNACDINTSSGIRNLIDRGLLSIVQNNKLMMHQLVQELGRDLVRHESPDKPWERSRLWCHEESLKALEQEKGTEKLHGLALDMRMIKKDKLSGSLQLKTNALSKMDNLKLLQLNYVRINGSYNNISKELRWLCMHGFHFKSIPSELPMENLVVLDMSYSNIESFDMSYSSSTQRFVKRLKGLIGSSSKDKRLLGSLKILNLSFCEQLHSVGGFFELPVLEMLIVKNCISLIEVCESLEQCVGLVHIDLSYCYNLKKLPISLGKLKKIKTVILDGCNSHGSQIKMWDMDSTINISSQTSSYDIMKAIPSDFKFFMISLPSSLRILSLANNNLCNGSFPMDLSCLSMLEELCLDKNPIVSMPSCVRSLPRLQKLSMKNCGMVKSIKHPPSTLRVLSINYDSTYKGEYKTSLRKIKFDQKMSPLRLRGAWQVLNQVEYKSELRGPAFEIDGMIKIQSLEEKVLRSLGWTNLNKFAERDLLNTQVYYEFGIFSTFYEGWMTPDWITYRSNKGSSISFTSNKGSSISFTIPSSPKNLRGFNFGHVESHLTLVKSSFSLPKIKISNITKNQTWIYDHYVEKVGVYVEYLTWLSHWMFGPNEMTGGDNITINIVHNDGKNVLYSDIQITRECWIDFVYEEDGKIEEEEDVLGYYKSWNHIIGGDLSAFQLTTGEYILDSRTFMRNISKTYSRGHPFIKYGASYKEDQVSFKAFS